MVVGLFSFRDQRDDEMQRTTRVATMVMAHTFIACRETPREIGSNLFPPLIEAALIHWHDRVFTITGFERIPHDTLSECSYRQSWMLRVPTAEEMELILKGKPGQLSGQQCQPSA